MVFVCKNLKASTSRRFCRYPSDPEKLRKHPTTDA